MFGYVFLRSVRIGYVCFVLACFGYVSLCWLCLATFRYFWFAYVWLGLRRFVMFR